MSLDIIQANRITGQVTIEPSETLFDPVSKFRVSTPSNLIDTDFEYGLQSTKWETLELINNIPTFFSREGSSSLDIASILAVAGNPIVTVNTNIEHGLVVGNVIIVKGATLAFADGTYAVLTTPSATSFTYQAKRQSPVTGDVKDASTEILQGNLYQGTEFKLENLGAIATDGQPTSTITVSTFSPHGFKAGTSFILLNSLTSSQITFDSRLIEERLFQEKNPIVRTGTHPTSTFLDYRFQTKGEIDAGSGGMISVAISGSEDEGTFVIQFPTDTQFKFFNESYDRIWVNTNSSIAFTNLTTTPVIGGSFKNLRPKIDVFGTGLFSDVDWVLMNLYYLNTAEGLRIRWEGKEYGDSSVSPTLIWEMFFDTQLDSITLSFITVDFSAIAANTFSTIDIYDQTALVGSINLGEFVDDLQRYNKEIYIVTSAADETKPSVNGYATNDVDFENFGVFQPYRWDAYKEFKFSQNKLKPTLYFTLSDNTPYNDVLYNNTNYIKKIQHNVITFADPHGLEDRRGYLYHPGIANQGLVIGSTTTAGSVATTAPTIFHLRTLGGTTGLFLGAGVYTFTGSTVAISASSATNNRLTIASNASLWIGDPVVIPIGTTVIGGLTAGTVYYVREIIGTTQITLTTSYDDVTGPGSEVTLTTQTLATTLYIGGIITDPLRQVVLTDRAAPQAARFVSYGTTTPRLPIARDIYGPHAFIATARIHYYQVISGNTWIASADTDKAAFGDNQPFVIFAPVPTGATASTNNFSTAFTPYWVRNPNSNLHTYTGTNRAPGNRDHVTVTNAGSIAAVAANAETVTLTVAQSNLRDLVGPLSTTLNFDATASGVNITGTGGVGTGDTITIPNHGLLTADAIVYNRNGGTLIGGLTDGTIYYAIRVDDNTIRLATTAANANTNTGINLTSVGTGTQIFTTNIAGLIGQHVDITNTTLNNSGIRYGIVTAHTGTTTRTITIKLDYANYAGSIVAQNNNCTVTFYGSNATRPFVTHNLSTALNGANLNLSAAVYDGYIVPVKYPLNAERTWYHKGHNFQSGDLVRFEADNTIVPGAYTNATYYVAEPVSLDRFRLLTTASAQIIPTSTIGISHEFAFYDPSPYIESDSKSTNSWLYTVGAVGAGGTSAALSYPAPAYSNTTVPVPNANAGSVVFTCSILQASITNVPPNTSGVGVLGARIKFYDVNGADLLLADSSSINDLDIRVGTITGTTTRAIECRVLTPGGLPANLVASATARIVIDTGLGVREENRLAAGSSWTEREYNSTEPKFPKNNTYFPTVNAKIADYNEISPFPYTTLKNGRITAVSAAQPIAVTYTFNSNLVNIVSAVRLNNVVTLTTNIPHGFKEGETITVASVTDAGFNGTTFVIKAVSPTTIVYDQTAGNATSANGTVSQTIQAISPKILTISTITSASPAVVTTTATHTLVNGQAFHFQGIAGSPWGALWDNKVYYIKVVSGTVFQVYKDRALTVPLDTSGNSGTPYVQGTNGGFIWALGLKLDPAPVNHIFNSRSSLLTSDTIYSPGYGLNDGTSVTYTTGGGVAIGGLSGGITKFVRTAGADRFRLADTASGWDTAAITISSFTTPASLFTTLTHGFTTNKLVQYTCTGAPIVGLQNGAFYYVRVISATTVNLYWTSNGAINAVASDLVTVFGTLPAGSHTFRQSNIVDLTSEGEGDQHAVTTPTQIGTLDGVYEIADAAPNGDTSKFTLTNPSNSFIPKRTIAISSELSVDLFNDAIFTAGHGLVTGTPVTYNVGVGATPIGNLVDEQEYYAIKVSDDYFRLADSQFNANNRLALSLRDGNGKGVGSHEFQTASIVGAIKAPGTVTANANNTNITGTGTLFTSNYRSGDTFYWAYPPVSTLITRTVTFSTTTFTNTSASPFNAAHFLSTGMSVRWNSTGAAPTNLVNQQIYYVRYLAANTLTLHPTYADALANTNAISATGGSGVHSLTILTVGNIGLGEIQYVNSNTRITLKEGLEREYWNILPVTSVTTTSATPSVVTVNFAFTPNFGSGSLISLSGTGNAELDGNDFVISTVTANTVTFNALTNLGALTINNGNVAGILAYSISAAQYDINSSLLIRADSAAVHRPYDGGVEIVATSTPDSKMIRQTRRYFRYQSGKGIQVSFAINFSPTVVINNIQGQGATALITTRLPHRLTSGVNITIIGESSGNYNGNYTVGTVETDYAFRIILPTNKFVSATGRPEFYVPTWNDAAIRCGLFDDQNGMFFEYDGSTLYCVRRNSTKQVGGSAAVFFGQNAVFGTDTKYSSELSPGDYVVIRGQSYKVIEITNNNLFYIQPSYRGVDANNVVISTTRDEKFAQQNWNIDPCDGTGPTGYDLNINRIQMAYMDYSWYGAGKVRFGFKDNDGIVRYVHQIVHNNLETEAYLRSGNLPARYEVQTGDAPTFIPNLAHWGTSVIMDGEFQEDKAYLFSVIANPIYATSVSTTSVSVTTVRTTNVAESQQFIPSSSISGTGIFLAYNNNRELIGEVGYALQIDTHNDLYYTIPANAPVTNTSNVPVRTGTVAVPATSSRVTAQLGSSPYLKDVIVGFRVSGGTVIPVRRNLLIINKPPSNNFITNASVSAALVYDFTQFVPLLSVRLSPSVDNGVAAGLGLRDIINRMQLTLQSLDVLATHECEFQLVFNATLDNLNWQNVQSPSLSQVIYHSTNDTITGGSIVYTFLSPAAATQANGSANNAQRELASTTIDLRNVATLGNSILGGDGVFPDGPDVVTLRFRYIGLPGLIGVGATTGQAVAPFRIGARLSWAESQA